MYQAYFGLNQPPFKITPDTRLFFAGGNRGAVLQALVYAIANGEGIVKVVGEVGSGKTMLCRMLEVELPDNVEIVYLANPSLGPAEILHAIALELGIAAAPTDSRLAVVHRVHEFLLGKHGANRRVVAFIEEAQGMPLETLEEIRLLSNLETSQDKLLQIVLFGQPELEQLLAGHHIRQLRERITYSFTLEPFGPEEVRDYINSRLRASGYRGQELFERRAVREIARTSGGLLRRINILADKALLAAYADNSTRVRYQDVRRAAADSRFESPGRRVRFALAGAGLAALALVGYFAYRSNGDGTPGPVAALPVPAPGPAVAEAPVLPPSVTAAHATGGTQSQEIAGEEAKLAVDSDRSAHAPHKPVLELPALLTLEVLVPVPEPRLDLDALTHLATAGERAAPRPAD